jgi:hypothetical protein
MNGTLGLLKGLYHSNKIWFFVIALSLVIFVTGCAAQGSAPPSGPVGGGCG